MNKGKLINLLLILTSLVGYLEWGGGNSTFLFQAEADILRRLFDDPRSTMHPFVLIPLIGQILLLITLFQKKRGAMLTYIGMGCVGILIAFMLLIGILGMNYRIILSTLPFLTLAIVRIVKRKEIEAT